MVMAMDYEKKYKEALETARKINSGEGVAAPPDWTTYEVIFPELKESEDERIRIGIINGFKECLKNSQYPKNAQKYWHNIKIEDILAWLEKQGNKPKKVSIWKHWKDGIAGGAEDEQIFLIKIGRVYSISSCLGCECDYIELSELDKLMQEEKQAPKPKWSEEDEDNLNMAIYFMRSENTPYSPTDVEPVVEWLCGLKQRMEK